MTASPIVISHRLPTGHINYTLLVQSAMCWLETGSGGELARLTTQNDPPGGYGKCCSFLGYMAHSRSHRDASNKRCRESSSTVQSLRATRIPSICNDHHNDHLSFRDPVPIPRSAHSLASASRSARFRDVRRKTAHPHPSPCMNTCLPTQPQRRNASGPSITCTHSCLLEVGHLNMHRLPGLPPPALNQTRLGDPPAAQYGPLSLFSCTYID